MLTILQTISHFQFVITLIWCNVLCFRSVRPYYVMLFFHIFSYLGFQAINNTYTNCIRLIYVSQHHCAIIQSTYINMRVYISCRYCFNGFCPTLDNQCETIWGYGGVAADKQCFDQYNSKGSREGHCGNDASGALIKCSPENIICGSLQCQMGNRYPVIQGLVEKFSRTIISIKGVEYECK